MTHVVLAELAFQRQDALAARARDHHFIETASATPPARRSGRRRSGILVGRLPAFMTRA
jgi:hypothetical protein